MKGFAAITHALCVFSLLMPVGMATGSGKEHVRSAFESTTAKIEAMPADREVPVEWHYTNHWDFPMIVAEIHGSCTCLGGDVKQVNAGEVPPGGNGVIRGHFTPGPHRGLLRKSLRVRFAGHEGLVELVAEARVASTVEITEDRLDWTEEARDETRSVEIHSGTGEPFEITGFTGSAESHYGIEKKTIEEGMRYQLKITPEAGAGPGLQTLLIRTDSADRRDRVKALYLRMPSASGAPSGRSTTPEGHGAR